MPRGGDNYVRLHAVPSAAGAIIFMRPMVAPIGSVSLLSNRPLVTQNAVLHPIGSALL